MSRRVLITGVTGYLGSALAEALVARGDRVRGLVRPTSARAAVDALSARGVELVTGDVTAPDGLAAACAGADLVVHAAAVIAYRRRRRAEMVRVNVLGTRNVVDAARRAAVGRLLHVSSIVAVGIAEAPVLLDEETEWNAGVLRAGYFDTKHEAEREVAAGRERGLDTVVVNPGAVYGPSSQPSNSNRIVARIASGGVRLVPRGGVNVVPLSTVVAGVLAAAERGRSGRRYVLGGENLGYGELVRRVGRAAGLSLAPRRVPTWLARAARPVGDLLDPLVPASSASYAPEMAAMSGRWMWFETRRMRRELGVVPGDLDRCLEATVAEWRAAGRP